MKSNLFSNIFKLRYLSFVLLLGLCADMNIFSDVSSFAKRRDFERYMELHPLKKQHYQKRNKLEIKKGLMPTGAYEQDYLTTMDPITLRPEYERLDTIYKDLHRQLRNQALAHVLPGSGMGASAWQERGPNNVGGRTRAILFDPDDATNKKVWAGGVTGGLWYNNDITSASSSWVSVDDFWANLAVTCIDADPNNSQIFYVGTGESFTGASRGGGIWKTIDGGQTWNRISSTTNFFYVNDIKVRNEGGSSVVYAAVDGRLYLGQFHGSAQAGLQRSTNGGNSWTQVLPNVASTTINYVAADIEIAANNTLWIGTKASPYGASDSGGGRVLSSTNGTTWTISNSTPVTNGRGRVELACAPNDANYVYALVENDSKAELIKRTTNGGSTWQTMTKPIDDDNGIPANDFTRNQAFYDLILAVAPNNRDRVIAGGINMHMSANGGSTWSQISKWSNNPSMNLGSYSYVHADIHQLVFRPGTTAELLVGTDGGLFYTPNVNVAATQDLFEARNNNYNVTQFYAAAIHPTAGNNTFLAGSQDNGTQRFSNPGMNATTMQFGGDGAFCFIDEDSPQFSIVSYVYNNYYLFNGTTFIKQLLDDDTTGFFINPADYHSNLNMLFSSKDNFSIYRVINATSATSSFASLAIPNLNSDVTAIKVSPFSTSTATLFLGTLSGDVLRVNNAQTANPTTSVLTAAAFPNGSVSSIEFGTTQNEIIVTFKNYGVNSIWYSIDGGVNWLNKQGDLPDMPVRWALINPGNNNEVILATEIGAWGTSNFQSSSPNWTASNSGFANVRTDQLRMRSSDNEVIAATHGRGLYSSSAFNPASQVLTSNFSVATNSICEGASVSFTNLSFGGATSAQWFFPGGNPSNSTAQNPTVSYASKGSYPVTLIVSNSGGSDTLLVANYINVGAIEAQLEILTDNYGVETTWEIADSLGNILYSGGGSYGNNTLYNYNLCLMENTCYTLTVFDDFGDGMCCSFGNGYFKILDAVNNDTLVLGGQFTNQISVPFCIPSRGINTTITANNTSFCEGGSTNISVSASGGNAAYSYQWAPSAGLNNTNSSSVVANPTSSTTYFVTVSSGSFSTVDSIEITVNPNPVVFAGNDQSIPLGTSANLSGNVSNAAGPFFYAWTPSGLVSNSTSLSTNTVNLSNSVNFIFFAQDQNTGCNGVDTVRVEVVNFMQVSTSVSDTFLCPGESSVIALTATGGSGNYTYNWSNSPGLNASAGSTAIVSPMLSAWYSVTVSDGSTQFVDSIYIEVAPDVDVFIGNDTTISSGSNLSLSATLNTNSVGPFGYSWSPAALFLNSNLPNVTANAIQSNQQISVQVNDLSSSCVFADTIDVQLSTVQMSLSLSASSDTICAADLVQINATISGNSGTVSYNWQSSSAFIDNGNQIQANLNTSEVFYLTVSDGNSTISDSIFVYVHPELQLNSSADTSIFSGDSLQLFTQVSGGSGAYSYLWSPGTLVKNPQNSSTFTQPLFANTNFSVQVNDLNTSCSSTDSIMVLVNAQPLMASFATATDTFCHSENYNIPVQVSGGSGNYTYQWFFNSTLTSQSGSTYQLLAQVNGQLICEVSDGINTVSATMQVATSPPMLTNAGGNQTIAFNGQATLSAIAIGGYGSFNFFWSPDSLLSSNNSSTVQTLALQDSTLFTVTATDITSSCHNTASVQVNVMPELGVSIVFSDSVVCQGDSIIATAQVSGGSGNYNYTWSNNANTLNTSYLLNQNTTIGLSVSDGFVTRSATKSAQIFIPLQLDAGTNQSIYQGNSANLIGDIQGATPGFLQFSWEPANLVVNPSFLLTATQSLNSSTTFHLHATDLVNNCSFSDSVYVEVLPLAPLQLSLSANENYVCESEQVSFNTSIVGGTGTYTYTWSSNVGTNIPTVPNPILTINADTWIYLEISDGNSTISDSIFIRKISKPNITISAPSSVCRDANSFSLTATPDSGFFQGIGVSNGMFNPTSANIGSNNISYHLQVETCVFTEQFQIEVLSLPSLSLLSETVLCIEDSFALLEALPAGGNFSGDFVNGDFFQTIDAGVGIHEITYAYTDQNLCSNVEVFDLTVVNCNTSTFVISANNELKLYPNPATDLINLKFSEIPKEKVQIQLLDINGKVIVDEKHNVTNSGLLRLEGIKVASGSYFLRVSWDDNLLQEKIIFR